MTTPPSASGPGAFPGADGGAGAGADAGAGAGAGAQHGGAVGAGRPPPGWYLGPSAPLQWWDGGRWWPPQLATDNSVPLALLAHLGPFVGGFLVPLVVLLTEGRRTPFVKHHATEALNFQITTGLVSLVLGALYVAGILSAARGFSAGDATVGVFAVVPVVVVVALIGISIASLVFVVLAAARAGQQRYFRYPVSIRFVRGAASKVEIVELESELKRGAGR